MIEMENVESSNVEAVGYDYVEEVMRVRYKGGKAYDYMGVPADKYAEALAAPSLGKFLAAEIKPVYRCEKVEE